VDVTGWTDADQLALWIQRVAFAGTARGMLQLLFGAGMIIMAARVMVPDGPVGVSDAYYRRNLWLVLFGLAHAFLFLWYGEILFPYGLAALLIFQFRTLKPKWLLLIGVIALLGLDQWQGRYSTDNRNTLLREAPVALALKAEGKPLTDEQTGTLEDWEALQDWKNGTGKDVEAEKAGRSTTLSAHFKWNADYWLGFLGRDMLWLILEAAAMMLVGAALFKLGILQGGRSARFYLLMLVGCLAIALPLRIWDTSVYTQLSLQPRPAWLTYQLARLPMTLAHVALINLLFASRFGGWLLRPFVAAGQLPLTMYFGQSILCIWIIFAPWGLGLWGQFGFAGMMGIAAGVIAILLVFANLWVRRFENGPFEWLWKSLAYVKRQPFAKARS
ncbi:MAG: DUF418 domain-containing protein, partial [Sandaracinobacteroides sp.]